MIAFTQTLAIHRSWEGSVMFWWFVGIGVIFYLAVVVFVLVLCKAAARGDRMSEEWLMEMNRKEKRL